VSVAATTTLSSRGQDVIPEEIRSRLGLAAGTRFVVIAEGDAVIFKVLQPPSPEEFKSLLERTRKAAKITGMKRSDIQEAIDKVRRSK